MIKIYSDGACKGNPGPGGWGAVLIYEDKTKEIKGFESHTTNNRMELTAVIKALEIIKRPMPIEVYTDSQYLKNGITLWINTWVKNNWNGGKVKNIDLWQRLLFLTKNLKINWYWVRGHNGDKWNELADSLANLAISEQ